MAIIEKFLLWLEERLELINVLEKAYNYLILTKSGV